jgi:hypothetical protein
MAASKSRQPSAIVGIHGLVARADTGLLPSAGVPKKMAQKLS